MKEFVTLATKRGWKYYYFAGFDTPYRKYADNQKNSVEAYFGIFNFTGKLNTHYDTLTINVTNMTDGAAIPISKTVPAPTTAPPKSSAVRSLHAWLLAVISLALTITLW
jgi:hypothetical protein